MRDILGAVSLMAVAAPAHASDWRQTWIISGQSSGEAIHFIDASSIDRSGDHVDFSAQLIVQFVAAPYDVRRFSYQANCRTYVNRSAEIRARRRFPWPSDAEFGPAETAPAGSFRRQQIDMACGAAPLDPSRIANPYDYAQRRWGRR